MGDEPSWSIEHRGLAYCYTDSKWTPPSHLKQSIK